MAQTKTAFASKLARIEAHRQYRAALAAHGTLANKLMRASTIHPVDSNRLARLAKAAFRAGKRIARTGVPE